MGGTGVAVLRATMEPALRPDACGSAVRTGDAVPVTPIAGVSAGEGPMVAAPLAWLRGPGMAPDPGERIGLAVQSDLAAVGPTAALAAALGRSRVGGIVAGCRHVHRSEQWERRGDAMAASRELAHA